MAGEEEKTAKLAETIARAMQQMGVDAPTVLKVMQNMTKEQEKQVELHGRQAEHARDQKKMLEAMRGLAEGNSQRASNTLAQKQAELRLEHRRWRSFAKARCQARS